MRSFSAQYLEETRRGLWAESRDALSGLSLADRQRILEVGCGTGELTRVLAEETPATATVIAADRDRTHLTAASTYGDPLVADALHLPLADGSVDLAVCQALLVNLASPEDAVAEFARVSMDLIAAIEPDNANVTIESTVDGEAHTAARAREAFFSGAHSDPTLGSRVDTLFDRIGLRRVEMTRYAFTRTIEPPYDEPTLAAARRHLSGAGLAADRETLLAGGLSVSEYDALRTRWRSIGRKVAEQMQAGTYRRRETVPLYVTVGAVA